MGKFLLAGILLCSASVVSASQCNVEIKGDIQFENSQLSLILEDQTRVKINQRQQLFVDGEPVLLTAKQQQLVDNYYFGIQQVVPQVADIATDAVVVANMAITEVFTELLGEDNYALEKISRKLQSLDQEVHNSFYAANGELRLASGSFQNGGLLGQEWQASFEQAMEELVTESLGSLMISIGTELILNGGNTDEFEAKMERFGQQLEQKVESQALVLEDKVDRVCELILDLDVAEQQLQSQVYQLQNLDLLHIEQDKNRM